MTSNMKLTDEQLQKLREVPIHQILGLPKTGRNIRIPCPIHNGKNDNFILNDNNSFHCFKCGAGGHNAIDFCTKLGLTFQETIESLEKYL